LKKKKYIKEIEKDTHKKEQKCTFSLGGIEAISL
jgi:hypothetical protein